ncbi:hypothetical protein lbkm_0688 [Lachnospiraceae bacterium KM106-2]|nr:hypothetical protein lbkm_0688 [Lachnospiraceae bacterium KM106-2]
MDPLKDKTEETVTEKEVENELIISLTKPYQFEGKAYKEIDLTGLKTLTAADMIRCNHLCDETGNVSINQEMTLEYACNMASIVSDKPINFFMGLPPIPAMQVKRCVMGFFYGMD